MKKNPPGGTTDPGGYQSGVRGIRLLASLLLSLCVLLFLHGLGRGLLGLFLSVTFFSHDRSWNLVLGFWYWDSSPLSGLENVLKRAKRDDPVCPVSKNLFPDF